jgi:prolyl-tRNA synthetase
MPVLQPAELWKATGRYGRRQPVPAGGLVGKHYVLAMTHEECITCTQPADLRSYRELPQIWYHSQTKERDEPGRRAGSCARASSS